MRAKRSVSQNANCSPFLRQLFGQYEFQIAPSLSLAKVILRRPSSSSFARIYKDYAALELISRCMQIVCFISCFSLALHWD